MTLELEREKPSAVATMPSPQLERPSRPIDRFRLAYRPRADYVLAGLLACLTAVSRSWNFGGYPLWFTDEGVYVSQAWAVQNEHQLAPYTYWYDHPPLGWIQITVWSMLTGAWHRHPHGSILVGREFMVVIAVTAVVLTYILAIRLGFRRPFAFAAGLLYVLSPLAVTFSRYVLLDNIAIVWVLAAMVLALSPQRRLSAVAGSGLCLAAAILSKETALLFAPAVWYLIWQNYRQSPNRGYAFIVSISVTTLGCVFYPLYALLKGELIPGPGHVSLWQGQVMFQLATRNGSGSILSSHSNAWLLAKNAWLGLDPWLPLVGVAVLLPALFVRKLRGPATALGVQVVMLFKGGYLPFPFIISMLPFMALLVGGMADTLWLSRVVWCQQWYRRVLAGAGAAVVTTMLLGFVVRVMPGWTDKLHSELTADDTKNQVQALAWVEKHIPHHARLVTEGELWLDIRLSGFDNPEVIWTYKVDTDPAVRAQYGDLTGLDYLVLDRSTIDQSGSSYPTLNAAAKTAKTLATFGSDGPTQIVVMQVANKP